MGMDVGNIEFCLDIFVAYLFLDFLATKKITCRYAEITNEISVK